ALLRVGFFSPASSLWPSRFCCLAPPPPLLRPQCSVTVGSTPGRLSQLLPLSARRNRLRFRSWKSPPSFDLKPYGSSSSSSPRCSSLGPSLLEDSMVGFLSRPFGLCRLQAPEVRWWVSLCCGGVCRRWSKPPSVIAPQKKPFANRWRDRATPTSDVDGWTSSPAEGHAITSSEVICKEYWSLLAPIQPEVRGAIYVRNCRDSRGRAGRGLDCGRAEAARISRLRFCGRGDARERSAGAAARRG